MEQEKLIELIREYPYLYDPTDRRYCNGQNKDEAWKEIADKLNVKVHECKRTWALLRDCYRRAIKRQKITGKKWKYEDEMSFLLPCFRRKLSNSGSLPKNEDKPSSSSSEESSSDDDIKSERTSLPSTPSPNPNLADDTVSKSSSKRVHSNSGPSLNLEESRRKIRKKLTPESTSRDIPTNTQIHEKNSKDIQQFFESIITTVQSFPPRERAIAKAKVFNVISEMEIEILSRDSNTNPDFLDFGALYKLQENEDEKTYSINQTQQEENSDDES